MRAAVTGAAGFIGSALTDGLLQQGNEVVAVDNFDHYHSDKMRFLEPHMNELRPQLCKVDILDQAASEKCFEDVEGVFHLAAQAGGRISVKDQLRSDQANSTETLSDLLAAKEKKVRRFVRSSLVYGKAKRLPVTESVVLVPEYLSLRPGDVDHTWGDSSHARHLLG